jgi:hypothetical protein
MEIVFMTKGPDYELVKADPATEKWVRSNWGRSPITAIRMTKRRAIIEVTREGWQQDIVLTGVLPKHPRRRKRRGLEGPA